MLGGIFACSFLNTGCEKTNINLYQDIEEYIVDRCTNHLREEIIFYNRPIIERNKGKINNSIKGRGKCLPSSYPEYKFNNQISLG